ncbi:PXA domain-containing protein [Phellopilus nigrolimitatus]|nr:PXA domain-containing protein [Phellopilus nigrolimitatus]
MDLCLLRDFVLTWYTELSSSPSFPTAVSESVHGSLETLLDRVQSMDLASLIVRRILPQLTSHVDQFRYSETALRGAGLERHLTQSEELDLLLASRYVSKGGSLHPAVDNLSTTFTKQSEETHLRSLVDADANSKAVRIVAREIVACCVLAPITDLLSDPDFWNRTIDQLAGAAIRQQKLISKVRNVLESQSPSRNSRSPQQEVITLRTDARHFEAFLRTKHENEDWIDGKKTEDVVAFLDRLYTAKRKIEKRISILGGQDDSQSALLQDTDTMSSLHLRVILTNPSSLSYFMEFMDRRGRSLPVQFWLTVESFKNPLESVESDSSGEDYEPLASATSAATLKEDLKMINDLYFANTATPTALSSISQKHVEAIRSYATDESVSASQERMARRSVMLAQRQVEQDMDLDFEEFRRSDLWFRAVGDLGPKGQTSEAPLPAPPPLQSKLSSSGSLLTSLVQGFTSDLTRAPANLGSPFFHRPESTPPSLSAPKMSRPHVSAESSRSSNIPSPVPSRSASAQAPSSSLEFLMSSSDAEVGGLTRAPLFDEAEDGRLLSADAEEAQRMEAIQAAVTDIIASENRLDTEQTTRNLPSTEPVDRAGDDRDSRSVGSKRSVIFADAVEDAVEQEAGEDEQEQGAFHHAAPGDLHLSDEITRLENNVAHLQSQDVILDTLIRKAELTGDAQELRLLRKSKSALERELRQLTFQKMQYEQHDSATKLMPGRTKASIVSSTTGEEEGKQVVRYLIEVQQLGLDGTFASGWVIARRYSEFLIMHQRLKERYLTVKNLDFPGKHLVTALSVHLVDSRKAALEKYLQNLLTIPMVCDSQELRAFLSRDSPFIAKAVPEINAKEAPAFPGHNIVRNMYRSFTESIDEVFFGPSMLDVMIGRLTRQAAEFAGIVGTAVNDEDLVTQALKASGKAAPDDALAQLPGDLKPLEGETSTSSFTAPICDLILAVFELDKKNNWLRRQAIVIILQQVLGDTVERKFRDSMKSLLDEPHLLSYINIFKDGMWPGGRLKSTGVPRTSDEKARTRDEANRKLSALLPDVAANMMGRSNARRGARRIFAVLQNRRLNQHIVYTVLDEIFVALFPETSKSFAR